MRTLLNNILCLCLLAGLAGAALAQTPDGQPPSVEIICNELNFTGAAWGLCNAYCEAMDCDCPTNGDPENPDCVPNASPRACDRVLANFYKHADEGVVLTCNEVLPPDFFSLEVVVSGSGHVTSDVAGETPSFIDCPDVCTETYAEGTIVTLTATPDAGWSFDGWGADCAGAATNPTAMVTMTQIRTCTAAFSEVVVQPEPCPCVAFFPGWDNPSVTGNWTVVLNGGFTDGSICTDANGRIQISDPSGDGGAPAIFAVNYQSPQTSLQCEIDLSVTGTAIWSGLSAGEALGCHDDLKNAFEVLFGGLCL